MRWAAIDFETANAKRDSACALGIVIVEGQKIIKKASWLIRPPNLIFDPINICIHGITRADVIHQPNFNELWSNIYRHLEGNLILAHYACFDMSVLRHVLDIYGIPYPRLSYYCTHVIAKRLWPDLGWFGLEDVARHLRIRFKHHVPDEDAYACAKIALRACHQEKVRTLEEVAKRFQIRKGDLFPGGYKPCGIDSKFRVDKKLLAYREILENASLINK